jgi:hypothetical protein
MLVSETQCNIRDSKVENSEETLRLVLEGISEADKLFSKLEDSVKVLCRTVYLPKAEYLLLSMIKRYKKINNIRNWNDFEKSLPDIPRKEFDFFIKDKLVRGSATCVDDITWEALETMIVKYMPGAQNLFQYLKNEMKKDKKYPFSQ